MSQHYLAIDFGAESGRAIVGTLSRGVIALEEVHRFANPSGVINGTLCWNLQSQFEEIKKGLRAAGAKYARIASVGVDTWGVDFGLLASTTGASAGSRIELLSLPACYRDSRTDGIPEHAFTLVSRHDIYKATGIAFMQLNSLYQLLAMKKQDSVALANADRLLFMPDVFNFLLSGQITCEETIASTSQMFDVSTRQWAKGMLTSLGLSTSMLGTVIPAGTVIGPLRADVAAECGIERWTVVAPGTHDTASAVAAVPAEAGTNYCYLSSGTWSLMGVELDKPLISQRGFELNFTNEIGVGGKIRFLKNIAGLWLIQECKRHFEKHGKAYSYAELMVMAAQSRPFERLINVNDPVFARPGDMPEKIAAFCISTNQSPPLDVAQTIRCCVDSLAMEYRRTLDQLEELTTKRIEVIHIVGGGTQNLLLNELTADVCNRPVVAGPVEATALGNVLTQAIAVGDLKSLADARRVVRNSFELRHYLARPDDRVATAYHQYLALVGDTK